MAAKKYASTEILNAKGKPIETRGIIAGTETVKDKDENGKDITIKVTDAIVDFVAAASQEKAFKEKKDKAAGSLRTFISDVRTFFAKKKDFTKTYRVIGPETDDMKYAVDVSCSDKYTLPAKKEDMAALKKLLTVGVYKQIIEEQSTISIKKTITDDPKKCKELTLILIEALGKDKIAEYFDRSVVYKVKPGLSGLIYDFPEEVQKNISDNIKPASDAVKDASEIIVKD